MEILIAVVVSLILASTDNPTVFQYRSLRFLYGFGLPLYFRVFKVLHRSDKVSIPRWKIEHWMVASGFSKPMVEEDGDGGYILMEFIEPLFRPFPMLMRAKISWNNKDKNAVVWGYAAWTYFIIFAYFVTMLLVPIKGNGHICFGILLLIFLLWCGILYLKQFQRLHSLGEKIAEYLSEDYQG
jgi:hypothetical protein